MSQKPLQQVWEKCQDYLSMTGTCSCSINIDYQWIMPYEDQLKGFGFEVENPFSFLDRLRAGAIKTDNNKISTLHEIRP